MFDKSSVLFLFNRLGSLNCACAHLIGVIAPKISCVALCTDFLALSVLKVNKLQTFVFEREAGVLNGRVDVSSCDCELVDSF